MNEIELTNSIRKNVEMGIDGIKMVRQYVKGDDLAFELSDQMREYRDIHQKASEMLEGYGGKAKDVPTLTKLSAEAMGVIKSLSDSSDEKIAEDMVRSTTTGYAKLTRELGQYQGSDDALRAFTEMVIATEEQNCEKMKKFLK